MSPRTIPHANRRPPFRPIGEIAAKVIAESERAKRHREERDATTDETRAAFLAQYPEMGA